MPAQLKIGTMLLALLALAGCDSETIVVEYRCAGPDLGLDGNWFGAMAGSSMTSMATGAVAMRGWAGVP